GAGSLGRRIQSGERTIRMEGSKGGTDIVKVLLSVNTIAGFSGHSNWNELNDFIGTLSPSPKKIIIVHGEGSKCLELSSKIHKTLKIETQAPRVLDALRIR
ncbi:MAG TPA: MBL fold metallo-hydrolase RNA specificity domain-containing protein, partial [Candidatus Nanoarchaeia archaeon]|nr:MBL fold metallo-hydrolase RNA specificity domain-containing protein [Candidatus Nanoarchaeia archaeon]